MYICWLAMHASHYNDVIMSALASQITSLKIVLRNRYSGVDLDFAQIWPLVTGEIPAQRVNSAEKLSIWWRHHGALFRFEELYKIYIYIYIRCAITIGSGDAFAPILGSSLNLNQHTRMFECICENTVNHHTFQCKCKSNINMSTRACIWPIS